MEVVIIICSQDMKCFDDYAIPLPYGVYFVQLRAETHCVTHKILFTK